MTRYTLYLLQEAYPEQIKIEKFNKEDGIYIECWMLNMDYEKHMLLFEGGPFKSDEQIDKTIQDLLNTEI
jgi:hypothetical protein